LVTVEQLDGHARYGMLETIRQFAEEQLAAADTIGEVWDRHARYFAAQAAAHWDIWDGPRVREALDWVDVEFANLRSAFRWAADHDDVEVATAIAAHTTMIGWLRQRYESVGWAEEMLEAATATNLVQLPRLYTAASLCLYTGRPDAAVGYAETAAELETDPYYDPFPPGRSTIWAGASYMCIGRIDRGVELWVSLGDDPRPGLGRTAGGAHRAWLLPAVGRAAEARAIADEALASARAHGNPVWITLALAGHGRAFADTDPQRARRALREALELAREHQLTHHEAYVGFDAAAVEAVHGDTGHALELLDSSLDAYHRAGDPDTVGVALGYLALLFNRIGPPAIAATLYGASTRTESNSVVVGLADAVSRLRSQLGHDTFDSAVAAGAAMGFGEAVAYARQQIRMTGRSGRLT
jgi:tetratricopeptide (TPR) repeat protein